VISHVESMDGKRHPRVQYLTTSATEYRRFSYARCCGAAGADVKPPTASGSERAGRNRHAVSSGISSSKQL
jgi:hypothetical protein